MPTPKTASGVAVFQVNYVVGVTFPGIPVPVTELVDDVVVPRTLFLGAQQSNAPAALYPPSDGGTTIAGAFVTGIIDVDGNRGMCEQKASCMLQYGVAGVQEEAVFDWRPGAYNLPPCAWARVQCLPWGSEWGPDNLRLQNLLFKASFAPGQMVGALQPTVTDVLQMTMGVSRQVYSPRKTAAIDLHPTEFGNVWAQGEPVEIYPGSGPAIQRNSEDVPPYYSPPWGPVQCAPGVRYLIHAPDSDLKVQLRFWLQL